MTSEKPRFDPKAPFEAAERPAFDPNQPFEGAPAPEPGLLSKAGQLAKEFFITGHPSVPGHESIEPSIGKTLAYPGGVISTAAIQGTKELAGDGGSAEDMKAALAGDAKSAPQQLKESGLSPAAAYAVGIPLQVATDPMAGFGAAPVAAGASAAVKTAGSVAQGAAERFATTPVFEKIARATNVVGKGKSIVQSIADKIAEKAIPDSLKPVADAASGIVGRAAVYKTPLAPVQAISDAARGVTFAQKGVASALDSASGAAKSLASSKLFSEGQLQRLAGTPFLQQLERAHERGGKDAVSTTHYLLQQTDPDYQKILKEEQQ